MNDDRIVVYCDEDIWIPIRPDGKKPNINFKHVYEDNVWTDDRWGSLCPACGLHPTYSLTKRKMKVLEEKELPMCNENATMNIEEKTTIDFTITDPVLEARKEFDQKLIQQRDYLVDKVDEYLEFMLGEIRTRIDTLNATILSMQNEIEELRWKIR